MRYISTCPLKDRNVHLNYFKVERYKVDMLKISMLLSCIFVTKSALDRNLPANSLTKREIYEDFDKHAVTCYICVNVSDNFICNKFAIDRPCKPGETFCHTLHIMDSKGTSVLVNKKCTSEKECQRTKVGCVEIDMQTICVSCCDENYCNVNAPTNTSNAIYDDKITKMRMLAKNFFREREKALTTTIKESGGAIWINHNSKFLNQFVTLMLVKFHTLFGFS